MININSKLLNGGLDMKVTKIEIPSDIHNRDYINLTLSKNIINDYLFEKSFIKVCLSDVEPIEFLYRIMYEELYLKREYKSSKSSIKGKSMEMLLSLSEAIFIIRETIPPIFKHREKEAYQSLEDIRDTLSAIFEGIEPDSRTMNIFKKHTGLTIFQTHTNYDFNRMKLLREFNLTHPLVDIFLSPVSVNELYDGIEGKELEDSEGSLYRESTGVDLHAVFNCIKKSELNDVINMIHEADYYYLFESCKIHILNIFTREFEGYFVELYIANFDSAVCKTLNETFRITYKDILKK